MQIFVSHLKFKAETFLGQPVTAVVHGRPVRFVDDDDAADAKAEGHFATIARRVGFREVTFVYEPIAAAYHYEEGAARGGGADRRYRWRHVGFHRHSHRSGRRRARPDRGGRYPRLRRRPHGRHGFRFAVQPGCRHAAIGPRRHLVEKNLSDALALYRGCDLGDDQFQLYASQSSARSPSCWREAREPERVARLQTVINDRLGHRIAIAAEQGQVALSSAERLRHRAGVPSKPGCTRRATRTGLRSRHSRRYRARRPHRVGLHRRGGLKPEGFETIFFTGGSSRVPAVRARFPAPRRKAPPSTTPIRRPS